MAKGGRASFTADFKPFARFLEVQLRKVERGTKRATEDAARTIYGMSQGQVPRETNTLASSGFYTTLRSGNEFVGIVGYGGNSDPINPKTGQPASQYMVVVHEDLDAEHPIGKAKYLEDPVREYQSRFAARSASFIRREIGD